MRYVINCKYARIFFVVRSFVHLFGVIQISTGLPVAVTGSGVELADLRPEEQGLRKLF